MHCNHCKKEQETITIAGKTYCANCSTVLDEKKVSADETPKHKIPKIEITDNPIRTEIVEASPKETSPEIQELSRDSKIPEVNKDDLEGSAILLDILSDNAKESADQKTVVENKKLEDASEEVLDILMGNQKKTPEKPKQKIKRTGTGVMNDISIGKRSDYSNKKHRETLKTAEKEIKDEAEKLGRIITSESGYTKEYDIMIMSIALTAIMAVVLAIFMTFR
jgi:hypothetical protein